MKASLKYQHTLNGNNIWCPCQITSIMIGTDNLNLNPDRHHPSLRETNLQHNRFLSPDHKNLCGHMGCESGKYGIANKLSRRGSVKSMLHVYEDGEWSAAHLIASTCLMTALESSAAECLSVHPTANSCLKYKHEYSSISTCRSVVVLLPVRTTRLFRVDEAVARREGTIRGSFSCWYEAASFTEYRSAVERKLSSIKTISHLCALKHVLSGSAGILYAVASAKNNFLFCFEASGIARSQTSALHDSEEKISKHIRISRSTVLRYLQLS